MNIPLKCSCGQVQGSAVDVSATLNRRFICYCSDCQAYAHFLKCTDQVLDKNGGTEVVPVHPAKIQIFQGREYLECVRLSDDGMIRWYARCCRSPVANLQPSPRIPFAGIVHTFMDTSLLGPVYARANGKYGILPMPPGTPQNTPLKLVLSTFKFLGVGIIKGLHSPSPFFDEKTGEPQVVPTVLSDSDYDALIELTG